MNRTGLLTSTSCLALDIASRAGAAGATARGLGRTLDQVGRARAFFDAVYLNTAALVDFGALDGLDAVVDPVKRPCTSSRMTLWIDGEGREVSAVKVALPR